MSVLYGKIEMPEKIKLDKEGEQGKFARFTAEPFERGFGHTNGNLLRRVLLSSLESPAIISVIIDGVEHEFAAVEGIIEDMTDIILNIKGSLLRKLPTDESHGERNYKTITCKIDVSQSDLDAHKGQVAITLGDLIKDGSFEVVNPELHILTVVKPMKKQVEFKVGFGRGYVPSERHSIPDKLHNEILLDAAFSPVLRVNYFVEYTRVGQDTDYDRLILEVLTDGRITPTEALTFASQIGAKQFEVFSKLKTHTLKFDVESSDDDADYDQIMEQLSFRIDEIELSVRSANCLSGASIDTIAELVTIPERKMLEFRNFGKKSLNEIKAKLNEMGLELGMDLSRYGINHDNARKKVEEYILEKGKDSNTEIL